MDVNSIGSGIAIAGGCFSFVAIVYRVIPKKTGFSQVMCNRVHNDLDRRMIVQDQDAEKERKDILEYLIRIETKIDKHIAREMNNN